MEYRIMHTETNSKQDYFLSRQSFLNNYYIKWKKKE
jgi:hypothetical protein